MPKDDQDYVSLVLSSISNDLTKFSRNVGDYSNDIADKIERNFNNAAGSIRQAMHSTSWIPNSIKPPPPPPPPRRSATAPLGYLERLQSWTDRHRVLTAAIITFLGTGTFLIWHQRRMVRRKRRARRTHKGAKTELVVLAGSPFSPLTQSLALDLEYRGFIVYIPVGSLEEETAVIELRAPDVHSLNFDITNAASTAEMRDKLMQHLINPQRHGTQRLHFASLILLDSCPSTHPTGTIETLSAATWSDSLNTHVLYPIFLAHAFIPVLISEHASTPIPKPDTKRPPPPTTLVLLTPSTIPSLHLPNHAPESLATAALTSWLATLRRELPAKIPLTHLRLGSIPDLDLVDSTTMPLPKAQLPLARLTRYGSSPSPQSSSSSSSSSPSRRDHRSKSVPSKSAALFELHHGLFDAIVGRRTGTVYLGRGARTYALVGAWVPNGIVGWMMGFRMECGGESVRESERRSSHGSAAGSAEWEKVEEAVGLGQAVEDSRPVDEYDVEH